MLNYAATLRECLPQNSSSDLLRQFKRKAGDLTFTQARLEQTIGFVRKNYIDCGYTIPWAKKGRRAPGEERRWYAVPVERDGSFSLDDVHRDRFNDGARSGMSQITRMYLNLKTISETIVKYERSAARRERLEEIVETSEFMAKRSKRLLRMFEAA
jgi:hypothetical protein